jgi:hypothetical protein
VGVAGGDDFLFGLAQQASIIRQKGESVMAKGMDRKKEVKKPKKNKK